ncbi:MAG: NAD(P)-dependent oxidoreductase [Gammaproteobacteria bacterium]
MQNITATAEHTFGLILSLVRHTTSAVAHVLNGGWNRNLFWGTQLSGKALGIIGHGRIGAMVACYGESFGMKIVAFDTDSTRIVPPARSVSLQELMETSDVVSVHVTATPENCNLIDRDLIFLMKPGAWFINTARGSIVDNAALADAVSQGRLAGVAVDVVEGEEHGRIDDNPLLDCARKGGNVLITPHIGGATVEAIALTEAAVVSHLCNFLVADNSIGE